MSVGIAAQRPTQVARVLVTDDHEEWRPLIEALLSEEGYEVMLADSGERALDIAASATPDIVVLGLSRWEVNCIRVAEQMRQLRGCETIPIILITAAEALGDCLQSSAPAFNGHISRGDVMSSLAECLKVHLQASGS